METEMRSILVQGVGSEQKKVMFFKNHDFVNRKFNSKFQAFLLVFEEFSSFLLFWSPTTLKCLPFHFP